MDVQLQLYKISPLGPERLPPEGGRVSQPDISLGQYYVHPGEGRPLPSEAGCRDPRQEQDIPVTIVEPLVSPKIAHPVYTKSRPGLGTSSLGGKRPLSPFMLQGTSSEAEQSFL